MKLSEVITGGRLQKVIVEYKDDGGPEWWVMFNDGAVEVFDTSSAALRAIQKRAARGNITATITTIEWRNTPDGFVAPTNIRPLAHPRQRRKGVDRVHGLQDAAGPANSDSALGHQRYGPEDCELPETF